MPTFDYRADALQGIDIFLFNQEDQSVYSLNSFNSFIMNPTLMDEQPGLFEYEAVSGVYFLLRWRLDEFTEVSRIAVDGDVSQKIVLGKVSNYCARQYDIIAKIEEQVPLSVFAMFLDLSGVSAIDL